MILALCDDTGTGRTHAAAMTGIELPGPTWPLDLATHLREHLVWMRLDGRAEKTLFARRRAVVRAAEFHGRDAALLSFDELYSWQVHLLQTSLALVRHQTALVRPYYGWLHAHGYRLDDPARLLPMPRARRGLPRPIADTSLFELIAEAQRAKPRLLPWLLLAGWCGLRAGEIAHLRVDSFTVDHLGHVIVRVIGKGGAERIVPVPAWCWPTIEAGLAPTGAAWRRERGHGPVTAQHVSQYCCEFLHRMGCDDTLHALRHRVGTVTYEQTRDIRLVQDLLGHRSINTTAIYTRVASGRLAGALDALPRPDLAPPATRHLRVVDDAHGGSA